MIETDRADYSRAELDHDLVVAITNHGCVIVRCGRYEILQVFSHDW